MIRLQPFQDRFLSNAFKRGVRLAILSVPRGQGKSSLMAWILAQCLNPESDMFIGRGADLVLVAGSIEQAGYCFKPLRNQLEELDAKGYSFTDSSRSLGVRHKASNARLRVISSNANRSLGLGATTKLVVADECSSWNAREGQSMFNALTTSQGKPGNESMRIICISTLAPAFNPEHWFRRLVAEGTDMRAGRYVQQISGNLKKWKSRAELKRCNPLSEVFPESLKILERELAEAKTDPAKEAVYKQFRLNIPVADESEVLLSSQQFQVMVERETAECHDWESLIFGVDLGGSRSWSSVVCIGTESLRVRCLALTGGIPSIADQEERDGVAAGEYQGLVDGGLLHRTPGKRYQSVHQLLDLAVARFGRPEAIVCDRFRFNELHDVVAGQYPVIARVSRWSEASEDIRATRKLAVDDVLNISGGDSLLLAHSIMYAVVQNDDAGNMRLVKAGTNGKGRDDVAVAFCLAAGEVERGRMAPQAVEFHHIPI